MKEVEMAMLVEGVAKVISGSKFPSTQALRKARKAVEYVLATPALDLPTLAERDQLRADKMAMFDDAKRWAEEAGRLAAELSDARLEIAGLRRDAERYRWLRDMDNYPNTGFWNVLGDTCEPFEMDEAIDAAMSDKPEGQG